MKTIEILLRKRPEIKFNAIVRACKLRMKRRIIFVNDNYMIINK